VSPYASHRADRGPAPAYKFRRTSADHSGRPLAELLTGKADLRDTTGHPRSSFRETRGGSPFTGFCSSGAGAGEEGEDVGQQEGGQGDAGDETAGKDSVIVDVGTVALAVNGTVMRPMR
jgi:hypothetical protein